MKKIRKKRFGLIGTLMVAVAMVALTGVAHADGHLKFPIGEGGFNWDSYHAFAKEPTTILASNSRSPQGREVPTRRT